MSKPFDPQDEEALNPPPKKYVVSSRMKSLFLLGFCAGVAFYFYMIVERRMLQQRYHQENQLLGVKLSPSALPKLVAFDPNTLAEVALEPTPGRWMLLNLWATWCPPCREEMPSLELLRQKLGHKLDIVALSMDDNAEALDEFIRAHRPSFQILWDKEHKAPELFGVSKYPETFLISPQGRLAVQFSGPRDWASDAFLDYFSRVLVE